MCGWEEEEWWAGQVRKCTCREREKKQGEDVHRWGEYQQLCIALVLQLITVQLQVSPPLPALQLQFSSVC